MNKKTKWVVISITISGLLFWLIFSFIGKNHPLANIALKKDNNTYLFSLLGSTATKMMIDVNQEPMVAKTNTIVELDDELYIDVFNLENITSVISGNYKLFKKEKKHYNGYITKNDDADFFSQKTTTEEGEKIGVFNSINLITLKNKNETFAIKWSSTPEMKAEKNCRLTSIWVDSRIPGEISTVIKYIVVVRLKDIISFYKSELLLDYNEEDQIMYLTEP